MSSNKAFSGILPPCAYEEGRSLKSKLVVSLVMIAIRDNLMSLPTSTRKAVTVTIYILSRPLQCHLQLNVYGHATED